MKVHDLPKQPCGLRDAGVCLLAVRNAAEREYLGSATVLGDTCQSRQD